MTARKKTPTPVQEALQTTFVLKGTLKRAQLMYLRIGVLLAQVRDRKLFEALKHPDMESYARERLGLGRSTLYNYLNIHDWVSKCHPEWLRPKPKGFIPDLSDIGDLMWLESELSRTNLSPARRTLLEKLRDKGLAGTLTRSEMRKVRSNEHMTGDDGLRRLLSSLRQLRKRASRLEKTPPEVIVNLDAAIQILANNDVLKIAHISHNLPSWTQNQTA